MRCDFVVVFVSCICGFWSVKGQDLDGVPCETPTDEYGLCITIDNCPYVVNLLVTQRNNPRVISFIRSFTCGYSGNNPLVCCPQSQQNTPPTTRTIPTTTTTAPPSRTPRTTNTYSLPRRPECGRSNATNPRIVNGVPAKLAEFPWIVALGYKNSKNQDAPKWLCGGTLITERHILTAAHCVYNRDDLYLARIGDLDLYSDNDGANPETIPLSRAKIHEEFNSVQYTNDIAILTLARSPRKTTAWPICLPIEDDLINKNYIGSVPTVAGWGSIYFHGPSSSQLLEATIPVMDNQRCHQAYGNRSVIDNRVLCAGYTRGGTDACQGDSGGPLMHRKGDQDAVTWYYQIGVVSYGIRCAEAGYPGVYTRVTHFLDWIQKNVN